jgi:hypothetical protein
MGVSGMFVTVWNIDRKVNVHFKISCIVRLYFRIKEDCMVGHVEHKNDVEFTHTIVIIKLEGKLEGLDINVSMILQEVLGITDSLLSFCVDGPHGKRKKNKGYTDT